MATQDFESTMDNVRGHLSPPEPSDENLNQRFREAISEVIWPIWIAAWHPYYTVAGFGVLGLIIAYTQQLDYLTWLLYGLISGTVIYGVGVYHVNQRFRSIVEAFLASVENATRDMMGMAGEGVSVYTLRYSTGDRKFILPNRVHHPTILAVGDSSLAVHDDSRLALDTLQADIGPKTSEYYYDSITGVDYEEPEFQIKTSDGRTDQYESSRNPDDALYDLQNRIREYKAVS